MVVGDLIRRNGRRYPNKEGLVQKDKRLTWGQVDSRTNALANSLRKLGVNKGDRIASLQPIVVTCAEVYFACAKIGAISVPLNFMGNASELIYMIDKSEASILFVHDECRQLAEEIAGKIPSVQRVIGIGEEHGYELDYEDLISSGDLAEPDVVVDESDIYMLIYTGGTTGFPKGAIWTHKNVIAHSNIMYREEQATSDDHNLVCIPLFAAGGNFQLLAYTYVGATIFFMKFDPENALKTVEKERITCTIWTPTLLIALLNYPHIDDYDTSSLRLIAYGSSPMEVPNLKRAMRVFKCDYYQIYGGTEAVGILCSLGIKAHRLDGSELMEKRMASAGREMLDTWVRLVDDEGNDVAPGEVGEIIGHSDGVIQGYWRDPEATAENIKNGWWHTGDLARMDEDGYIYIVDRKKDMIVSGGLNVYAREVENVIYSHPAIKEAVVIGVPDDKWGEAIKAVVSLKEGQAATEKEIIAFCKERMTSYKCPKSVDFVEDFPRRVGYKISKAKVKESYWQGYDRRVHG